ncbi:MAG: DMT family transporter, partial [Hyphomicrobiaceae bacterium]
STSAFRPAGPADYGLLLLLAAVWGGSFMLIKIGVESVPALPLTALRMAIAAVFMWVLAMIVGERLPRGAHVWGTIALAALFGNALPFLLISWGEEVIESGHAAILMSPMPLVTMILAHLLTADEKLTPGKLAGVGLGVAGLIILIGPDKLWNFGGDIVRQLAVTAAGCCYAVNAVVSKRLVGLPQFGLVAAVMIAGAAMLAPFALLLDSPWLLQPTARSLTAIAILAIVQSALGTILLFVIVRRQGASFFAQINFFVPLFGVLWGALVLAERPSANAYLALAVILIGVGIARK